MTLNKQQHGTPFSVTATGSTSAVATQAGVTGQTFYITDIAGSSDKTGALLTVKQGTTVIWQIQIVSAGAGLEAFSHQFSSPLSAPSGASVSVTVGGTAECYANIAGFIINN